MKIFTNTCTFDYSWVEVSTANWRKYCPWNEKSTHVIAVDTLSRHVDPDSGILRTERIITCKQNAPKWICAMTGAGDVSQVFEISYVDPASQQVTMVSSNLTLSNLLSVQEKVIYKPLSETQTQFMQEAKITALCGGWQKIKTGIEETGASAFSENAQKGREGFETVLEMSRKVFGEEKKKQQKQRAIQPQLQTSEQTMAA